MTNKIPDSSPDSTPLKVGDKFHLVDRPMLLKLSDDFNGNRIVERGETIVVSPWLVQESEKPGGAPWFRLITDAEAQITKWGRIRLVQGPATAPAWDYGDPRWEAERRSALALAWNIVDESDRALALAAIHSRFDAPGTKVTLGA